LPANTKTGTSGSRFNTCERDWNRDLVTPLLAWFKAEFDKIPEKESSRGYPPEFDVPGVGRIWVTKRKRKLRGGVHVGRTVPSNVVIDEELPELMQTALDHKYERLGEYKEQGFRTITLLDARDPALTNQIDQYVAYIRAKQLNARPFLEEIWLADVAEMAKDTYVTFYCFRFAGSDDIVAAANYEGAMFEAKHEKYWLDFIAKEDAAKTEP
jgi:hypothetical protein